MRHIPGFWNAVGSDMYIETTFMRYGHGKKGIIGLTLKPETLNVWSLSLHICSRIKEDLKEMNSSGGVAMRCNTRKKKQGRIKADYQEKKSIRKKLEQSINPLDPSKHPTHLVNIVTGTIAKECVNVDTAIGFGSTQMT